MNFRRAVFVLTVFLLLAGIHLFIAAQNIGLKYQITDLKIQASELSSKNRRLNALASKEENLAAVEKTARKKLGMLYPEKIIYITGSKEAGRAPN